MRDTDLPFAARVELKTLSKENAEFVARHLVMASALIDSDPELAHEHALSASRRGGRIGMVREALAITAYSIGDYALALRELRTYRRISGRDDEIALMVDCERGLGRPDRALELGRSVDRESLEPAQQVQLAIAMSGARLDQGQAELALVELEIPQLDRTRAFSYSPALFGAYAEVLDELSRADEAGVWRRAAERAETALTEAAQDEYETIDVITERSDDEDAPAEPADPGVDLASEEDAEPGADSASLNGGEPDAALASADDGEPDAEPASVEQGESDSDLAAVDRSEPELDPEPDAVSEELPEWDPSADLQAQIQAEYDEIIAEIEAAADAAASAPDTAATDSVEAESAAGGAAAPMADATASPTPVSEAGGTVEQDARGATAKSADDDQPSLFDL